MSLADSLLSSPGGGDYGSAYDDDDNAAAAKRSWTEEEDAMLLKLVNEHGPRRWAHLSTLIPGRAGKQCRERCAAHCAKLKTTSARTHDATSSRCRTPMTVDAC